MKYQMVFDMGHSIDGIEFDDFETAKNDAIETLVQWICDEQSNWKCDDNGKPSPTEEQMDSWDIMIADCACYVVPWNEETNDWDEDDDTWWYPSAEEENEIGWLYWEELKSKNNW